VLRQDAFQERDQEPAEAERDDEREGDLCPAAAPPEVEQVFGRERRVGQPPEAAGEAGEPVGVPPLVPARERGEEQERDGKRDADRGEGGSEG